MRQLEGMDKVYHVTSLHYTFLRGKKRCNRETATHDGTCFPCMESLFHKYCGVAKGVVFYRWTYALSMVPF